MKKALLLPAIALYMLLCACGTPKTITENQQISEQQLAQIKGEISSEQQEEIQRKSGNITEDSDESIIESPAVPIEDSGIRPELKDFLDSYEAFIDEYVDFIQSYYDNPTNLELLSKYSDIMNRYAHFVSNIDDLDTSDMTSEELAYYIEVTSRASQKMILAVS